MEIDQATYLGFLLGQDLLLYDPAAKLVPPRALLSVPMAMGRTVQCAAGHQDHTSLEQGRLRNLWAMPMNRQLAVQRWGAR